MSVPQNVLDALNVVQADADDVVAKASAKDATATALTSAQTADTNAGHDLAASQAKKATDLAALQSLLQTTYGG
jgi:hypothetical protein